MSFNSEVLRMVGLAPRTAAKRSTKKKKKARPAPRVASKKGTRRRKKPTRKKRVHVKSHSHKKKHKKKHVEAPKKKSKAMYSKKAVCHFY